MSEASGRNEEKRPEEERIKEYLQDGSFLDLNLRDLLMLHIVDLERGQNLAAEHFKSFGLNQTGLSRNIKRLSKALNIPLTAKAKHGSRVELTRAGKELARNAHMILAPTADLVSRARALHEGKKQQLRIGFSPSAIHGPMSDLLKKYRQEHSEGEAEVELILEELHTAKQISALHDCVIDIGFLRSPKHEYSIETLILQDEQFCVALHKDKDCDLTSRRRIELADLKDKVIVMVSEAASPGFHGRIIDIFMRAGIKPKRVQMVNQIQTMIGLVNHEWGVALVPEGSKVLGLPNVIYLPLEAETTSTLELAWLRGDQPPVVEDFISVARNWKKKRNKK
ncbi:MAG TPA: LysR family substrate-binding domain-containing protein [Chloroflexia bacterium]|jgi:DNA-binding transcriptional LysR family regulator